MTELVRRAFQEMVRETNEDRLEESFYRTSTSRVSNFVSPPVLGARGAGSVSASLTVWNTCLASFIFPFPLGPPRPILLLRSDGSNSRALLTEHRETTAPAIKPDSPDGRHKRLAR